MTIKLINLNEVSPDLVSELRNWRNSSEVARYFILDNISEETHKGWIENKIKKGSDVAFIIFLDEVAAGCVYLRNIDQKNKTAELGIFLKPGISRGKGLGTFAINKILQYSFEELGLEKVYLEVLDFNLNAIALYEKLNFKIEGKLRQHIVKDGKRIDLILMGLLKENWIKND